MTSLWLIPVTVGLMLYALMFIWNTSAVLIAFYRFYLRKLRRRTESLKSNGSVSLANTPDGANTKRKGISILRPLKGVDENLYENLNSFMELVALSAKEQSQSKIDMEMILCLQQNDKDLLRLNNEVVKKLVSFHNLQEIEVSSSSSSTLNTQTLNYTHTENCYGLSSTGRALLRVVTSSVDVGVNPKINNILVGYLKAAHDLVWIVDSNVINYYKDTQIIEESLSKLQTTKGGIGLIHHAPIGTDSCSLGALMEELFLNTSHLKAYLVFNTVEIDSCVIGKSLIFSRKELESYHQAASPIDTPEKGLQSFAKFIAEDNMIGQAFLSLGYKHYLSPFFAEQRLGKFKQNPYSNLNRKNESYGLLYEKDSLDKDSCLFSASSCHFIRAIHRINSEWTHGILLHICILPNKLDVLYLSFCVLVCM